MKINNIIYVVPNTKRFYVDATTKSGKDVQPLVEIELEADGSTSIVDIEFLGDDEELSEKEKYEVEDLVQTIDWERLFHEQ